MADRHLANVLNHLSRHTTADATDRDLLERFLRRRDEAAFAALVERQGGMVLGVCRRLLGHAQDAEDACQAVFVVLARKGHAIRRREALPGWLHGVACRVCRKLAGRNRPRPWENPPAVAPADVPAEVTWREVRRVLDEELNRLPAGYRAPLVLCYLEGKTQDEAARELGWSMGTVRGRVERGRDLLRKRLTRRGVTLSGALLSALLAQHAASAAESAEGAAFRASLLNVLRPAGTGSVSARAISLAEGVIRTMSLSKYVWAAAVGLTLVLLGVAAAGFLGEGPGNNNAGDPPAPARREANPPMPPRAKDLADEFRANVDDLQLTLSTEILRPDGRKIFWLLLHVREGVELDLPAGNGVKVARVSRAQGLKLIDVLAKFGFFRRATPEVPPDRITSHLTLSAFVQKNGQALQNWLKQDVDDAVLRLGRDLRACLDGDAATEVDRLLRELQDRPANLGKENLRFAPFQAEAGGARSTLFALADPGKDGPSFKDLYRQALQGKAAPGSRVLVGRLPLLSGAADRLEVLEFVRAGSRIEAVVGYRRSLEKQSADKPSTYYFRADLPELPPGRYHAEVRFQVTYWQDGREVPAPGAGRVWLNPLACDFEVRPDEPKWPGRLEKKDPALQANLAWHQGVGKDEFRVSWFPGNDSKIAMICKVDLAKRTATTAREVYDWATQASHTKVLSPDQADALRDLAAALPPSQEVNDLIGMVLVSVRQGDQVRTYRYSRLNPPAGLALLIELSGAKK